MMSKSFAFATYLKGGKQIPFDWFSGNNLPSCPLQGSLLGGAMATYRSIVGQWRAGFRKALNPAIVGRISKGTCTSHPRWGIHNGPDPMPLNYGHYLYRQTHVKPETIAPFFRNQTNEYWSEINIRYRWSHPAVRRWANEGRALESTGPSNILMSSRCQ